MGGSFERADHSGAYRENRAPRGTRFLNALRGLHGNFVTLSVHHVSFQRFAVDGLKSAEADVQSELADFHAALANSFQNFGREVQACRGSSDGTWLFGENRLVALAAGLHFTPEILE